MPDETQIDFDVQRVFQAVEVLHLKPGDVLILSQTVRLPDMVYQRLTSILHQFGVKSVILPWGVEPTVVQHEEKDPDA